ncbi:hypothetical protein BC826DRAFT_1102124 [Russula brevipes]|nr:hypothetical protein BC826DRAFT_1102124 [Russula brevipes]
MPRFLKALSQSHRSGRQQETRNIFTQKLGVALNRALERRLGKSPCPKDVSKAVDLLAGTKASVFVQHAIRAQEQLASLHAQLQRAQERNEQVTDAVQNTPESSITPQKRSAGHDDTLPRETKRTRVESASPRPRPPTPPPPPPPPASASDTATNPEAQAPDATMSPKSIPIAPQSMRSDPKFAEIPRAGSPGPQVTVNDAPPPRRPVPDTGQPTPPANPKSDAGHQPTLNPQHSKPASPKAGDAIPDDRGSSTAAASFATTMVLSAYTRPQGSSSPSLANVPGIWAIQVGKPSASQIDIAFTVDQVTASSVHRWATHRQGFDPDARCVAVHLVALPATAVAAAQQDLSQSPGGITPQAFTLALRNLRPQWPDDGSLVLQLNAGQPEEQTWFSSDMSNGTPLDVSGAVCVGANSLRIIQLRDMPDTVFAIYAALPTPESLAAALEWEKHRKSYSYRRLPFVWLPV